MAKIRSNRRRFFLLGSLDMKIVFSTTEPLFPSDGDLIGSEPSLKTTYPAILER
jgi:hypothetical protein